MNLNAYNMLLTKMPIFCKSVLRVEKIRKKNTHIFQLIHFSHWLEEQLDWAF